MEQVKVSIVIPVYNVAPYLRKCVASVQEQTLREIEIILVDDGSTDGSGAICDELAKQDERIRVIHKPNGGLSDARNTGTADARGEYISYVDSDDWVAPQLVGTLLREAEQSNADVTVCDLITTADENQMFPVEHGAAVQFTGSEAMARMLYQTAFDTSACGKLYRAGLMCRFLFPLGKLYEDLFTVYKVLYAAEKVVYIPQKLYAYRQNPQSIMNQRFTLRMFDELEAVDEIVKFVQTNCPQYLSAACARKFSSYCQVLRWMKSAGDGDETIRQNREMIWAFIKGYRLTMLLDRSARRKNRLAAACTFLGQKAFVRL